MHSLLYLYAIYIVPFSLSHRLSQAVSVGKHVKGYHYIVANLVGLFDAVNCSNVISENFSIPTS